MLLLQDIKHKDCRTSPFKTYDDLVRCADILKEKYVSLMTNPIVSY